MKLTWMRNMTRALGLLVIVAGMASTAKAVDPPGAPELDPGSMASALTVVSGGLLILGGRRAKK